MTPRRAGEDHGPSPSLQDVFPRGLHEPSHAHAYSHPQHAEDAYEAAMRAADALFAPAPQKQAPVLPVPPPSVADQSGAGEQPEPSVPDDGAPRGRILRAIDEEPVMPIAVMEEDMPKRRGRKPGSKNKPKSPVVPAMAANPVFNRATPAPATRSALPWKADETDDVIAPPAPAIAASPESTPAGLLSFDVPSPTVSLKDLAPAAPATPSRTAAGRRPARQSAGENGKAAPPGTEPFGWIRTKLAPGEQWKRRLPKIIW